MPMQAQTAEGIIGRLAAVYSDAHTELDHENPYQLLVATVLSAQTTDRRVNALTPTLFSRWPAPADLAVADPDEVEGVVRPLGMGPTRARRIIALADVLHRRHGDRVPDDQKALQALPGVGRKTAYVVRGVAFGHSLLAVDTHVTRLAGRFGWTSARTPEAVEHDVVALAGQVGRRRGEPVDLTMLSLRMILHGRRVCTARSPRCADCALSDLCPSAVLPEATA
jgi:endonuclease-3